MALLKVNKNLLFLLNIKDGVVVTAPCCKLNAGGCVKLRDTVMSESCSLVVVFKGHENLAFTTCTFFLLLSVTKHTWTLVSLPECRRDAESWLPAIVFILNTYTSHCIWQIKKKKTRGSCDFRIIICEKSKGCTTMKRRDMKVECNLLVGFARERSANPLNPWNKTQRWSIQQNV